MLQNLKDFKSKSKVIPCKDVRNLIATPECCLGSIKISFRELNKALIESREQRLKAEAQKKITESEQRGEDVGISQNMLSVLSTFTRGDTIGVAAVFSEWKQLVIREKATRYAELSNGLLCIILSFPYYVKMFSLKHGNTSHYFRYFVLSNHPDKYASLNLEVPPYRTHAADGSKRNGPKRTHASRHLRCGWRWSFSSVAQQPT